MYRVRSAFAAIFSISVLLLAGCGSKTAKINCPFTDLSWEATTDEMIALEGNEYDTYDSPL